LLGFAIDAMLNLVNMTSPEADRLSAAQGVRVQVEKFTSAADDLLRRFRSIR
jgi:hypothetical protein